MSEELILTPQQEELFARMMGLFVIITYGFKNISPYISIGKILKVSPTEVAEMLDIMQAKGILKDGELNIKVTDNGNESISK